VLVLVLAVFSFRFSVFRFRFSVPGDLSAVALAKAVPLDLSVVALAKEDPEIFVLSVFYVAKSQLFSENDRSNR
jgi:hypothetical protein